MFVSLSLNSPVESTITKIKNLLQQLTADLNWQKKLVTLEIDQETLFGLKNI